MGSFGVDIDIRLDPSSAAKGAKEITAEFKKLLTNVVNDSKGANEALQGFVQKLIAGNTRAARQVETTIKSMERSAELAGKSNLERLKIQQRYETERLKTLGATEQQINRIAAAQKKVYDEEQKAEQARKTGHGASAPGILLLRGARDIFEGRSAYGYIDIGRAGLGLLGGGAGGGGGLGFGAGAAAAGGGGSILGGIGSAVSGIGAATLAVGGFTIAIGASALASYKAAESIGKYSEEVHRLQVVTGLSAREAQQFRIAAEATGQDVSVLQRMMRGLTQAVEDTGSQGQKARETLKGMGVDLYSLESGSMKTTELLDTISTALEHQPNRWLRNKEAIDLFKRAGIDALPMVTELHDMLQRTSGLSLFSQESIDKGVEFQKQLAVLRAEWEQFKLSVLDFIAKPAIWVLKMVTEPSAQESAQRRFQERYDIQMNPQGPVAIPRQPPSIMSSVLAPEFQERLRLQSQREHYLSYAETHDLEVAEEKLSSLKRTVDELRGKPIWDDQTLKNIRQATAEYDKQKTLVEAMRQAETDRKAIEEALRRGREEAAQRLENKYALPAELELERNLRMRGVKGTAAEKQFRDIYGPLIASQRQEQAEGFARQMLETREAVEREIGRARQGEVLPVNIRELGQGGTTRADVEHDINEQYKQRMEMAQQNFETEMKLIRDRKIDAQDSKTLEQQRRDIVAETGKYAVEAETAANAKRKEGFELDERERDLERKHVQEIARIRLSDQEDSIKYEAQLQERRAQLRFKGDNPAAGIVESYKIAVTTAEKLYEIRVQEIDLEEKGWENQRDHALALRDLDKERYRAQEEAQLKLAEMQQQQLDTLKSKIEPLYETLFTHPSQFGQQLRTTVTQAALHPIVSGLSEMTSRALYPLIYGSTGTGGIAGTMGGLFGGHRKLSDAIVTPQGALLVQPVGPGLYSGVPGIGAPGAGTGIFSAGGPWFGGGTFPRTTPPFLPPNMAGAMNQPNFGLWSGTGYGGGFGVPGAILPQAISSVIPSTLGGEGPADISNLPLTGPESTLASMVQYTGLGGLSGGGAGGGGGGILGSILGRLFGGGTGGVSPTGAAWPGAGGQIPLAFTKGGWFNSGSIALGGGQATTAGGIGGIGGTAAGILTSPMAASLMTAVGLPLAMAGITGQRRGTTGGIFESGIGGALTGAGIGTMIMPGIGTLIGAGIGAAAGFGIGIGEKLFGVESPRNEAKRLVKQTYQISINNSTADQIVAIANQSYAGRVSIAVRSPEVRHMLGLYAAGTGQSGLFPQSTGEPHGASLVEAGGALMQQATYQYGNAYSYSSSLPVYGGVPTHNLGAPGGGVNLSLNIGGQDAAKFMTGSVVSPEVVSNQYAMAMNSSSGRIPQALMMSEPGSIAS